MTQKGKKITLHCIHSTSEDVAEAQQDVLVYLHETNEVFLEPILAVIEGGKK